MTTLKRNALVKRAEDVFVNGGDIHDIIAALEFHELYDTALSLFDNVDDLIGCVPVNSYSPEDYLTEQQRDYVWDRYNSDGSKANV